VGGSESTRRGITKIHKRELKRREGEETERTKTKNKRQSENSYKRKNN